MEKIKKFNSVKEMIDSFEEEKRNRTIIQKIVVFIEIDIVYPLVNIFHPIYNYNRLKRLYQRITRGWDDSDTWSLDYTIGKLLVPRLIRFKELNDGIPETIISEVGKLYPDCDDTQIEQIAMGRWNDILDKIILAFELMKDDSIIYEVDDNLPYDKMIEEIKKRSDNYHKIEDRGLRLFCKHYQELWC